MQNRNSSQRTIYGLTRIPIFRDGLRTFRASLELTAQLGITGPQLASKEWIDLEVGDDCFQSRHGLAAIGHDEPSDTGGFTNPCAGAFM